MTGWLVTGSFLLPSSPMFEVPRLVELWPCYQQRVELVPPRPVELLLVALARLRAHGCLLCRESLSRVSRAESTFFFLSSCRRRSSSRSAPLPPLSSRQPAVCAAPPLLLGQVLCGAFPARWRIRRCYARSVIVSGSRSLIGSRRGSRYGHSLRMRISVDGKAGAHIGVTDVHVAPSALESCNDPF